MDILTLFIVRPSPAGVHPCLVWKLICLSVLDKVRCVIIALSRLRCHFWNLRVNLVCPIITAATWALINLTYSGSASRLPGIAVGYLTQRCYLNSCKPALMISRMLCYIMLIYGRQKLLCFNNSNEILNIAKSIPKKYLNVSTILLNYVYIHLSSKYCRFKNNIA